MGYISLAFNFLRVSKFYYILLFTFIVLLGKNSCSIIKLKIKGTTSKQKILADCPGYFSGECCKDSNIAQIELLLMVKLKIFQIVVHMI